MSTEEMVVARFERTFEVAWRITVVKLAFYHKLFEDLVKKLPSPSEREKAILTEAILRIMNKLDDEFFFISHESFQSEAHLQKSLEEKFGTEEACKELWIPIKSHIKKLYPEIDLD